MGKWIGHAIKAGKDTTYVAAKLYIQRNVPRVLRPAVTREVMACLE